MVDLPQARECGQQAFDLGSKRENLAIVIVIKRFDAEPVTREQNFALAAIEQREGPHAIKMADASFAPMGVGVQNDFGVAVRPENAAGVFELASQLGEIIDLPIVDNDQ